MQAMAAITPNQAGGGVVTIWAYDSSNSYICIRQSSFTGNYAYSSIAVCVTGA